MLSDTDYELLDKRIKKIEDSVEMLRKLFEDIKKPIKEEIKEGDNGKD
jgi:chaperonin cofactor prefoldin